jgi:fibronectin-binding autotransporter adhesin
MGDFMTIRLFELKIFLFLALADILLPVFPIYAQTPVTVTTNAGDASIGSLGAAITAVNATTGDGIQLAIAGSPSVTLSGPLSVVSQNVTFLGTVGTDVQINVIGQDEAQSSLVFQGAFSLGNGVTFGLSNSGAVTNQLDASVTVESVFLGVGSSFGVTAGIGGTGSMGNPGGVGTPSGTGGYGGMGGGTTLITGDVTLGENSIFELMGGMGGSGGTGGSPANSSGYNGGQGGYGGPGWVASMSAGVVTLGTNSVFSVIGGMGGTGGTGGNGASGFDGIVGGSGGNGGIGGYGSGSYVTMGMAVLGAGSFLSVAGGTGGTGGNGGDCGNGYFGGLGDIGGQGGSAFVTIGSISLGTGSVFSVSGGTGGMSGNNAPGTVNGTLAIGGNGGNAWATIGSLNMSAGSAVSVTGGAGGVGNSGFNGSMGTAFVSIGSLNGSGTFFMGGTSESLQIESGDFSGIINGNEGLQKIGSDSLTLTGANTYSGATTLSGGVLNIQNDANLGIAGASLIFDGGSLQVSGAVSNGRPVNLTANGGTFDVNGFNSTLTGLISGPGGLAVTSTAGGGALTLTGMSNTYSGGTTISGGCLLNIPTDGTLGASGTTLTFNGGTLQPFSFNSNRSIILGANGGTIDSDWNWETLNGNITGVGSLTAEGDWGLNLFGNNTYSGGTNIINCILRVGNSTALGSGPVSNIGGILETDGLLIPIEVSSYTQGPQAMLNLEMEGSALSQYVRLLVSGQASLSGKLMVSSDTGFQPQMGETFDIVNAAGLTGQFSQVQLDGISGVRFLPVYYPTNVILETLPGSFSSLGVSANQKAVGGDLDGLFTNPNEETLLANMGTFTKAADYQKAFGQISPDGLSALYLSGFSQIALVDSVISQRTTCLINGSGGDADQSAEMQFRGEGGTPLFAGNLPPSEEEAISQKASGEEWKGAAGWVGNTLAVAGDSNAPGYNLSSGVFTLALDKIIYDKVSLGFLLGYDYANLGLNGNGALGETGALFGVYGVWSDEGLFASALAQGGFNSYSTQRTSFGGTAQGSTHGEACGLQLSGGYDCIKGGFTFGPVVAAQYALLNIDGFSEQGSLAPLTFPVQEADSLTSMMGAQAKGRFKVDGATYTPSLSFSWKHEFDYTGGNIQAGFGQGDNFTVNGPVIGQNGFVAAVGLGVEDKDGLKISLQYQGELGRANLTNQQFGGGVGISL